MLAYCKLSHFLLSDVLFQQYSVMIVVCFMSFVVCFSADRQWVFVVHLDLVALLDPTCEVHIRVSRGIIVIVATVEWILKRHR